MPGPVGQHPDPMQAAPPPPPAAPEIVRDGTHGRHPTIRRAIARFVADVAALPPDRIEARWRAETAEHLDGRTPGTRKSYVMRYRSALDAALGPDHPALGIVSARGLSQEIKMARRQASARRSSRDRSAPADSAGRTEGGAAEGDLLADRPPGGPPPKRSEAPPEAKAAKAPLWDGEGRPEDGLLHDPPRSGLEARIGSPDDPIDIEGRPSAEPSLGADRGGTEADTPVHREAIPRSDVSEADKAPRTHAHRLGAEAESEDTRPAPGKSRPVGRPGVVREAAAAFTARLRQTSSPAEIEGLWAAELATYADKADRTIKRNIAEHYRPAVLRALGADHPALAIVKLPAEVADRIRADDIARVAASHRHQVAVPRWREIVGRATSLLASDAPLDLVAGLLLVTGRRPYEVCCTGRFAPAPLPGGAPGARSRWTVLFSGQAKTKGRPGTRHDTAYEVPVLAEARHVIAALDALRASPEGRAWAGMTNEAFRATTLRLALTEAVVRAYGELWPESDRLEPRALRPLYAEIAYKRFSPPSVTKNSFFAAVLGHTLNDLHTSLSYMDYHLPDGGEGGASARQAATGVKDRLLRQSRAVGVDPDRGKAPN